MCQYVLFLLGKGDQTYCQGRCLPSCCRWRQQEGFCWHQWLSAGVKAASFRKDRPRLQQRRVRHLDVVCPKHQEAAEMCGLCATVIETWEGSLPDCKAGQQEVCSAGWTLPCMCISHLTQRFYDSEVCFHGSQKGKLLHYFLFVYHSEHRCCYSSWYQQSRD